MNNNILEFFVRMKDLMSGGLAKLASNAKQSLATVTSAIDTAVHGNERLATSFDRVAQRANNAGNASSGFGNRIKGILTGIGVAGILTSAMGQAANAQSQQIAFKVLTGSKAAGDQLYGNVVKMADSTPFESQDLGRSAKTMLGYGIDKGDVMKNLQMLGDIASASDNPAESLQSLSLAFGQVSAKGHLAGQEVLQMVNTGFNPLKEISLMTGESMDSLEKKMSKGAISADMVRMAFEHATGPAGKFHNMMKEQAATLGGRWSTFMDGVHHKLRSLGEMLAPVATTLIDFGTALMNGEGPALAMATAIGAFALSLGWASLATGGLSAATAVWNAILAMNPIVLVIGLVIALGIWIYSLAKKYEGWGTSLKAVWEVIKAFGQMAWIPFKAFGETSWYYIQKLWLNIKDFAESVVNTFTKVGKAISLASSGDFSGAKDALTANIQTQASKDLAALEAGHKTNQLGYVNEYLTAQKSMSDNLAKIGLRKKAGASDSSLTAAGIASGGKTGGMVSGGGKDSVAGGITGGGPRVININGVKFTDKIEVHAAAAGEAIDQLELKLQTMFLRVLNSGASVQ